MTTEDQITSNPANLGEVNLTLRYMQKGMDLQGLQLKEISQKIDMMASNYVQVTDFATLRHNTVTKEEFIEHLKADADHEARIRLLEVFKEALIGKVIGFGVAIGGAFAVITFIINHFYK